MDSDWAELPKHLLDLVFERLVLLSDYLPFSVVCMSWHFVAKKNQSLCAKISSNDQPPMLLISTGKEDTWNLYNIIDDKVLDLQLRIPNNRFCRSSKGWLISVEENFEVTLLNPFSKVKGKEEEENSIIRLPPLIPPERYECELEICNYYVYKATISADPILNANDCTVVVIYEGCLQMAFIRLNKDTTWTFVDKKWNFIQEVVHVGDKLYAVDSWDKLLSFDLTSQSNVGVKEVVVKGVKKQGKTIKRYIMDLHGKGFLMVQRYFRIKNRKFVTKKFKVFEMNFDECKWIEKNTLEDISLFLGDNSTVCVLASKFSDCSPNLIYFNEDNQRNEIGMDIKPSNFGVYDVKNRCFIGLYSTYARTLIKMSRRPPVWVVHRLFNQVS